MKGKKSSILLSFLLVFSLIFTSFTGLVYAEGESDIKEIRLVHLNDIHARVKEDSFEKAMGFPRLKTEVDRLKADNPNTLVLSAGDSFHGTTMINITNGEAMTDFMNMIPFDAMTPGNHDFNYGYDQLLKLKSMCDFPIITANVYEKSGESKFDPYIIKDFDGLKIGIFGLTTEETAYKTHPDNVKNVEFKDTIEMAKKTVKELKEKEKVDYVVALTHMGNEGTKSHTTKELIKEVKGMDLVIDGHSHEETNQKIDGTLLVQAGSYTKKLGIVDLKFKDNKLVRQEANLVHLADGKEDPEVLKAIEKLENENKEILGVKVGRTEVYLDGERENARTRETNLGNLITDIMLEIAEGDIAITNGGGIRASKPEGDLTKGDLIEMFPFTNTVAVVEASGQEILQALEHSVRLYPEQNGGFLQVAGMSFKFDEKQEAGKRVYDVKVGEEKLDLNKNYKLVTNDFLAAGGDGYEMFKGKPFIAELGLYSDLLIDYLEVNKTIAPKLEGRISMGDKTEEKPEEKPEEPTVRPDKISVEVDGKLLELDEDLGSLYNDKGRIMVPVRGLFEELGYKIKYDHKKRTVSIGDDISLKIGDKFLKLKGKKIKMDRASLVKNNRTYIPLRSVAEALNYDVKYSYNLNRVYLTEKEKPVVRPENISIEFDGKPLELDETMGKAFSEKGRIRVPVRGLFEELGHEIEYNHEERSVTIGGRVKLEIGKDYIYVDGKKVKMDTTTIVKDSKTYVPVRFALEGLGYEVDYSYKENKLIIKTASQEKKAA